ncbi:MAG TPA: hypothetical protein VEU07_00125 [Candidatus Acidoferrum sp.]|nr:hypothetical protein [Candidatus Acidoferrum sp.]
MLDSGLAALERLSQRVAVESEVTIERAKEKLATSVMWDPA